MDDGPGGLALGHAEYEKRAIHPRSGGQATWSRYPRSSRGFSKTSGFFSTTEPDAARTKESSSRPKDTKAPGSRRSKKEPKKRRIQTPLPEKAVAAVTSERRAAWEDDAATGYDGSASAAEERGPEAVPVRQLIEQHRAAVSELSLSIGTTGHSGDAALQFVNDLLTEARTLLGDDDATVLGMMNDTAGLLEMLGRRSSAAPLRRAVFERRRAVHGLTDPSTLHALATLAKLHLTAGGILPGSAPSTASSPLKEPPVTGSPLASSLGAESIGEDAWGAEHLEKLQQELIEARRGVAERDGGSGGGGGGGGEGGGEGGGSADPTLTVIDSLYAALGSIADERGGRKTPADGIRTVGGARAVNHRADGYRAGADIAEHSLQSYP